VPPRTPVSRVRWDRKFRTLLLLALMLIGWIGLRSVLSLLRVHAQATRELNLVHSLVVQNRHLEQERRQLNQRATIINDARSLGMVLATEQPYVITGLSGR
jgi:hypothetical protein